MEVRCAPTGISGGGPHSKPKFLSLVQAANICEGDDIGWVRRDGILPTSQMVACLSFSIAYGVEQNAKRCSLPGSNWRPSDYETDALPTEPKERHGQANLAHPHKNEGNTRTNNATRTTTHPPCTLCNHTTKFRTPILATPAHVAIFPIHIVLKR